MSAFSLDSILKTETSFGFDIENGNVHSDKFLQREDLQRKFAFEEILSPWSLHGFGKSVMWFRYHLARALVYMNCSRVTLVGVYHGFQNGKLPRFRIGNGAVSVTNLTKESYCADVGRIAYRNCSIGWEEGTTREEWNQGESMFPQETTESWLEQPCLTDKFLLTEEDSVSFQLFEETLSMRIGTLTEVYPEERKHVIEQEDSLNKCLEEYSLVLDRYETPCAGQAAPTSTLSVLGNLSLSLWENVLPRPFNSAGNNIDISMHSESACFSQNSDLNTLSGIYPPTTGMSDISSGYATDESNYEFFSNIEYCTSGNHSRPFCFAAAQCDKLSLQEKGNDNSFQRCDACISEGVKKYSDVSEELKQSCTRQEFHMRRRGPCPLSKGDAESFDLHGKRSLQNSSVSNDMPVLTSLTEFGVLREEINNFLRQYGVSRREFAKAARIGKNTVGKYLSGRCRKLSKDIVWKILRTYHSLRFETQLIESGQSEALEVCERGPTPTATILQESQPTGSYPERTRVMKPSWDRMNTTCVEAEDLEAEASRCVRQRTF